MAESGAGDADYGRPAAAKARPASPMEELALGDDPPFDLGYVSPTESRLREMGPPIGRKVPVVSTMIRRSMVERDESRMDDELKALGLWEEDMTEEMKKELLKVVADSKETAQREEAVRKSHFPRPTVLSDAAARDTWEKKDPPVGLVKPCMATSEPLLCSDRLDHTSRKFNPKISGDDDWPVPRTFVNPSRRNMAISKPNKRTPVIQRVYSMDQPVQLLWDHEDSSDDLYDSRLRQESTGARRKERPQSHSPTGGATAAVAAPQEHVDLSDPSALLSSWATLHAALKDGQSARGLPVRPWGHTRDASPTSAQDGSNLQEPDLPSKASPDEGGDARPVSAMEDGEAQGGQA